MTVVNEHERVYGWIPTPQPLLDAIPDRVDDQTNLPPSVDLTPGMPSVVDQGQLGSCTSNALSGAMGYDLIKQLFKGSPVVSRLFIYYNERVIEGTVGTDSGAMIHDGVTSLNEQGVCAETEWPYNIAKFTDKPPARAYTDAKAIEAVKYNTVAQDLGSMKAALAAGFPIVIGFTVYQSFESQAVADTGVVPMPAPGEATLGGHAVCIVGYDDAAQRFRLRNSWGSSWGQAGYFTMPYAYLTDPNLASDLWTIEATGAARFPA